MICPVCGSEQFKVVESVKRGESCDWRRKICLECGSSFIEKSTLTDIIIASELIPLTMSQARKAISILSDSYINEKTKRIRNA